MNIILPNKNEDHSAIAENFIQNFPFMTFDKAKEYFLELDQQNVQLLIRRKINCIQHDANNIVKLAVHMIFLPQELQYRILSEGLSIPKNVNAIMNSKSIYEHLRWRTMINRKWKTN